MSRRLTMRNRILMSCRKGRSLYPRLETLICKIKRLKSRSDQAEITSSSTITPGIDTVIKPEISSHVLSQAIRTSSSKYHNTDP